MILVKTNGYPLGGIFLPLCIQCCVFPDAEGIRGVVTIAAAVCMRGPFCETIARSCVAVRKHMYRIISIIEAMRIRHMTRSAIGDIGDCVLGIRYPLGVESDIAGYRDSIIFGITGAVCIR